MYNHTARQYKVEEMLNEPLRKPIIDRHEIEDSMEPLVLASTFELRGELIDLALELATESAKLSSSIPRAFTKALSNLVRSMNCYYSNLIEGHNTNPIEIEKALKKDYSTDAVKRNLQLEAEAHIEVQKWIDSGGISGRAMTQKSIIEIHKRFCELLPTEFLSIENTQTKELIQVVPGEIRELDIQVGRHIAISPGSIPRFLNRFEMAYSHLSKTESIVAVAAAHHRLLWIHPFLDGNGRVARLMSYASLLDILETGGIWSIARGLARHQTEYKKHLMNCDEPRQGALDGRGALSEKALGSFTKFFLQTCIDQVKFMKSLISPNLLRARVLLWAQEEINLGRLPPRSAAVLERLLILGELPRGEVQTILNCSPATARRITSALIEQGAVESDSHRAPIRLAFRASLASRWLPGLFPDLQM